MEWALKNNITSGTTEDTFSPSAPCTRAQMATFLWHAAGSPEPKNMSGFTDITADSYYAKAVAWAVENGITWGTGDGSTFSPDDTCTRAQMATFLFRMANGTIMSSYNPFTDVSADAYYAIAVQWAAENNITSGTGDGTTFGPDAVCTRGDMMVLLFNFFA